MPMRLEEMYEAPGHLIRRAQQIAVAIFMEETAAFDITTVQYATLVTVSSQPGLDQTRLVNLIALDRSTIGNVVERLEAKSLLRREAGTEDKRTKCLFPTPQGEALLHSMQAAVARAQARILAPLLPEDRTRFLEMLRTVVDLNNEFSRAPLRRDPEAAAAD